MDDKDHFPYIISFDANSRPYGKTYGQWTVEWWRWFLSTPRSINPIVDWTGRCAGINQPPSDVWFLAGKLGDGNFHLPLRSCTVPSGRAILIPIINCEANTLEYPELTNSVSLVNHIKNDEDTIVKKECYVDDVGLIPQRVRSDPTMFEINLPYDNVLNLKGGGVTQATGDGYWVFLKPLSIGEHFISMSGSCENGRLFSGAHYTVHVQ